MIHTFEDRLDYSERHSDAPWWEMVYKKYFPNFTGMTLVREDGWAQRAGIDRWVHLGCGRNVAIDEKIRSEVWRDFLLEIWSDEERRIPGWINKALLSEIIAYAFVPNATCYMLPVLLLQKAWRDFGNTWIKQCRRPVRAQNWDPITHRRWTTVSIPVFIPTVLRALATATVIRWDNPRSETVA